MANVHEWVSFLAELEQNNHKTWFDANRPRYKRLREEFVDLTQELLFQLSAVDEGLVGVSAQDCLFRINRDIRFSKDKRPYNTWFSAALSAGGRKSGNPLWYFHITHANTVFQAAGVYMPDDERLLRIRRYIAARPDAVEQFLANEAFHRRFPAIEGETAKRTPAGFTGQEAHLDLIKQKSFTVSTEWALPDAMTTGELLSGMVAHFQAMTPLNDWLKGATT